MEIVSTMGVGSLGRELDLDILVSELERNQTDGLESSFTSSGMVTIRFGEDSPAYTVYRTGSFQIRGARSEEVLEHAVETFRDKLMEVGVEVPQFDFRHATSVFLESLNRDISLESLSIILGLENTEYEPEQFPGLVYRPPNFEVTLLVFASGKVIVGGTTDREEANSSIEHLEDKINQLDSG